MSYQSNRPSSTESPSPIAFMILLDFLFRVIVLVWLLKGVFPYITEWLQMIIGAV